ncbi:SRPBCC family protein [Antrihabitans stalagmiti]|uniref:SRPBCC family protein n=1 Tax=Antrihabitans stalagmiti TaxID=2799499 RepID=UPI00355734BA
MTVDPLDSGTRSKVTIDVDFQGPGIGKLLVPLAVRPQARKEMPTNLAILKQQLEAQPTQPI